jgi:predicted nuclease of predicted toxin-antitoxin system
VRILIDECLDWRLCRALLTHECSSVRNVGWRSLRNGELLEEAEKMFDVFLTGDRNLRFQQNVCKLKLAIIVLEARSTRLDDTLPLIPQVLTALITIQPGQVIRIGRGP